MLERLIANQRSWMSAVASATGGSTFEVDGVVCVHQPLPHRELLVPFPERPPGADLLDRARELGAQRIGVWAADSLARSVPPRFRRRLGAALDVGALDARGDRRSRERGPRGAGVRRLLHPAAGVGGLFDVFVPEDLRRRGLGAALSRAASAKAAQLGLDTITLNAEFEPLYESLGFRSLGHGQTWWRHDL